jgi:hypothetical protein
MGPPDPTREGSFAPRGVRKLSDRVPGVTSVFVAVGIILTVAFEYYYTNITLRWTYSDLMPLVPPFGTGLSPLLQWLVIPPLVVWLTRRHLLGAEAVREAGG